MQFVRPGVWLVSTGLVLCSIVALRAQGLPTVHPKPPAPPSQPLPYSHRLHLELGLDCAECHVQPDAGPQMTFPANDTCTSCHATQPATTVALKRLMTMATSGTPIPWVRVYRLPEYVYWSHASHLDAGLTCANCHGPVHESDAMQQLTNVATKVGCVTCHETRQILSGCGDCHEPRQ